MSDLNPVLDDVEFVDQGRAEALVRQFQLEQISLQRDRQIDIGPDIGLQFPVGSPQLQKAENHGDGRYRQGAAGQQVLIAVICGHRSPPDNDYDSGAAKRHTGFI